MFRFWNWTEYEYRIVLFGPNYSNNSNSDRILIVSIENLDQILNPEYIRVLKMDRIRISYTTIRSSLFEYSNTSNNSDQHWLWQESIEALKYYWINIRPSTKKKLIIYLVNKEPGREEQPDAEEDHGEVGEDRGVDGGHVAGHGGDVSDGHL